MPQWSARSTDAIWLTTEISLRKCFEKLQAQFSLVSTRNAFCIKPYRCWKYFVCLSISHLLVKSSTTAAHYSAIRIICHMKYCQFNVRQLWIKSSGVESFPESDCIRLYSFCVNHCHELLYQHTFCNTAHTARVPVRTTSAWIHCTNTRNYHYNKASLNTFAY